jgi:methylated-DNA-protein-cysteine methyltransferase-like protein
VTYGDIAAYCGSPNAARQVGQIAHFGPPELPWQRVVSARGGLARGYSYGGLEAHKRDLEKEGLTINDNFTIQNFEQLRWKPRL